MSYKAIFSNVVNRNKMKARLQLILPSIRCSHFLLGYIFLAGGLGSVVYLLRGSKSLIATIRDEHAMRH